MEYYSIRDERAEMRRNISAMRRLKSMEKERDSFINIMRRDHERMNKQLMKYRLQQVQRQLALQFRRIIDGLSEDADNDRALPKRRRKNRSKTKSTKKEETVKESGESFNMEDIQTQVQLIEGKSEEEDLTPRQPRSQTPGATDGDGSDIENTDDRQSSAIEKEPESPPSERRNGMPSVHRATPQQQQQMQQRSYTIPANNALSAPLYDPQSSQGRPVSKQRMTSLGTVTLRECWVGKPEAIGSVRRRLRPNAERLLQSRLETLLNKHAPSTHPAQGKVGHDADGYVPPYPIHGHTRIHKKITIPMYVRSDQQTPSRNPAAVKRRCKSAFASINSPTNPDKSHATKEKHKKVTFSPKLNRVERRPYSAL